MTLCRNTPSFAQQCGNIDVVSLYRIFMVSRQLASVRGKVVYLPDGRRLGNIHDCVIDLDVWSCTHLFVNECERSIVEDGVHVAVPWRWVRAMNDVVILRWFPPTPIPKELSQ